MSIDPVADGDGSSSTRSSPAGMHSAAPHGRQPANLWPDEDLGEMSRVLRLLADAKRLRILLFLLAEQEVHVGDLCERLGQSQPSVSHHLALLRGAQLVEGRRQGKHNFYRLLPDRFEHLIDKLFCMLPVAERTLRFKRFALNYVPTNVAPDDGDASRSG